jgi:hypothetical protein
VAQAWRDLRSRYEFGVVVSLSWTTGVAVGYGRARRLGVVGSQLRVRDAS